MVCHDSWDKADADVACKEAGYSKGALAVSTHLDSYGLNFYMDEVDCNGTEAHLHLCKKGERNDCGRDQAAGAVCDSATEEDLNLSAARLESCFAQGVSFSPTDEIGNSSIFATSVQCQKHCAKNPDCVQFSYSSIIKTCRLYSSSNKLPNPFEVGGPPSCPTGNLHEKLSEARCQNGTCLIDGTTDSEGNVFQEGKAVCDDDWGEEEAQVVCRELGYGGGALTSHYTTRRYQHTNTNTNTSSYISFHHSQPLRCSASAPHWGEAPMCRDGGKPAGVSSIHIVYIEE